MSEVDLRRDFHKKIDDKRSAKLALYEVLTNELRNWSENWLESFGKVNAPLNEL